MNTFCKTSKGLKIQLLNINSIYIFISSQYKIETEDCKKGYKMQQKIEIFAFPIAILKMR